MLRRVETTSASSGPVRAFDMSRSRITMKTALTGAVLRKIGSEGKTAKPAVNRGGCSLHHQISGGIHA
jgi:hypothetical protein